MKDYTHIAIVLDRSGSMSSLAHEIIGGYNAFIDDQKRVPGKGTLTLVQFDNEIDRLETFRPLAEVSTMTDKTYVPRGMTKLYDAIGLTVKTVKEEIEKMAEEERPEKVLVAILTDGLENSSQEYRIDGIKALLDERQKAGWEFTFIGANQDAVLTGRGMGLNNAAGNMTYAATPQGATMMFASLSTATKSCRCAEKGAAFAYSEADKAKQSIEPQAAFKHATEAGNEKYGPIGSLGGIARKASLSPQTRSDIARTAAKARWSNSSKA
jgi:uncharacterized protein YegL